MKKSKQPDGKIIVLNGPSSAGKTTIARALQAILDEPFLFFSLDHFYAMVPQHILEHLLDGTADSVATKLDLARLYESFLCGVAAAARHGCDVIFETVCLPEGLPDLLRLFSGIRVVYVAVRCPLAELERRELRREDRRRGTAAGQFGRVLENEIIDVEVNTMRLRPESAARRIIRAMRSKKGPGAFEQMRVRLKASDKPPCSSNRTPAIARCAENRRP